MKNITLAIDDASLETGREYARKRNISFNTLVRTLLEQAVKPSSLQWLDEVFRQADRVKPSSKGKKWKREELYRG